MPKGGFQAIIFTSETGVASALHMTRLPRLAYCVGDQTALAARKAGFQTRAAAGDAGALIDFILQEKPVGPLLHICGEETRGDVAGRLVFAGIQTHSLIAYRQNPTTLTAAALRLLAGKTPVIVPLFSPRTAQIFATQVELFATAPLYVTAFSLAVAHALEGLAIENLQTATTPTSDAMIAAIRQIADAIPVA